MVQDIFYLSSIQPIIISSFHSNYLKYMEEDNLEQHIAELKQKQHIEGISSVSDT